MGDELSSELLTGGFQTLQMSPIERRMMEEFSKITHTIGQVGHRIDKLDEVFMQQMSKQSERLAKLEVDSHLTRTAGGRTPVVSPVVSPTMTALDASGHVWTGNTDVASEWTFL